MDLLGASTEEPWFTLEGQKVYTIYDHPHNLKALRNAQMKYDLLLADGTVVKKCYVDEVVHMDMKTQPRLLKKIHEKHLNPNNFEKMSVPLASELYSRKVAAAVTTYTTLGALPGEAMVTARFWEQMNNYNDSWNGILENPPDSDHPYLCGLSRSSGHYELWIKMYTDIEGWKFVGATNLKFPERMQMSMRAIANLAMELEEDGHGPLPVGHINNDGLENCHSCLRGALGHCSNPSAKEYPGAFCTCVINFMTSKVKGKNCRDDNALNLISLGTLIEIAQQEARSKLGQPSEEPFLELSFDERAEEVVELMEEEEIEDPDELDEGQEAESFPPLSGDEDFLQRLQAKMALASSVQIAAPIVQCYLKKVNDCEACHQILLSDPQFPLHIISTLSTIPKDPSKLPSQNICNIVTLIYKKMEADSPHIMHQDNIISNLLRSLDCLRSVQNFNLCHLHSQHKRALLKRISTGALVDGLLAVNQSYKEKKNKIRQEKKNQKQQRVQHL
ncbi:hypothetical protein ONE63_006694 [Megalurothrips usitatus]|uniref:Transposable element P transposase-like GTP-binding insertion domain-containing protein n=1 Tax=Megalurothrips usitatus TaxID=439358 RepID=A0AAV7XZ44_9NEOP|nr:hypothetical protein ONE63_006694 [Megalurothrips usitatus]